MDFYDEAMRYHSTPQAGKLRITPSKPLRGPQDLALAYTPGVAAPCQAIEKNPTEADLLTGRRNLVAVISNGTAVLGLGNIGALASKPVMEGKAVLFYEFGGVQAIDLEITPTEPDEVVRVIAALEPSFGGINLEDFKSPECFEIEKKLKARMNIPVFHDDQHGTAAVVAAAFINGLHLTGKDLAHIKCVVSGAGAGALACLRLLCILGLDPAQVWLYDSQGLVTQERTPLSTEKAQYAQAASPCGLEEALRGADVFLGLSKPNVLAAEALVGMKERPLILALANPDPEIFPEDITRTDAIIGTGRSDYPNQVNNVLCFPYLFRGALDARASVITDAMLLALAKELASVAREGFTDDRGIYGGETFTFGPSYFIPKPFDRRLRHRLPLAVARAAASLSLDLAHYEDQLKNESDALWLN